MVENLHHAPSASGPGMGGFTPMRLQDLANQAHHDLDDDRAQGLLQSRQRKIHSSSSSDSSESKRAKSLHVDLTSRVRNATGSSSDDPMGIDTYGGNAAMVIGLPPRGSVIVGSESSENGA